jgi:hypothetical protein
LGYKPYVARVVRRHFKSYGLAEKFEAEASTLITEFVGVMRAYAAYHHVMPPKKYIDIYVRGKLTDLEKRGETVNNWEVVFWRELKRSSRLANRVKELIQHT